MTQNPHRLTRATNFLAVAATSSSLREEGEPQATAAGVHTSLIDAEWDLPPLTSIAHQSGAHRILARAPQTTLIDAEWDLDERTPGSDKSERPDGLARAPHTTLIDAEWAPQPAARVADEAGGFARPLQPTLVGMGEELDPVITFVELDGPECLFDLDL